MSNGTAPARDALDDKVNRVFAGKVVRKDLVRKVKVGANVPVFVLEFLLGKYCASSDELAIQMGLQVVNDTLATVTPERLPGCNFSANIPRQSRGHRSRKSTATGRLRVMVPGLG